MVHPPYYPEDNYTKVRDRPITLINNPTIIAHSRPSVTLMALANSHDLRSPVKNPYQPGLTFCYSPLCLSIIINHQSSSHDQGSIIRYELPQWTLRLALSKTDGPLSSVNHAHYPLCRHKYPLWSMNKPWITIIVNHQLVHRRIHWVHITQPLDRWAPRARSFGAHPPETDGLLDQV